MKRPVLVELNNGLYLLPVKEIDKIFLSIIKLNF